MNTKSGRITATAIAATLAVSSLGLATAPAHAAQSSPDNGGTCSVANTSSTQQGSTDMNLLSGNESKNLTDKVAAGINDGTYTSHAGSSSLDFNRTKVYKVTSGDQTFTSVTVPTNGDYTTTSNFTALFDKDGNSVNYSETLYSQGPSGTFHLDKYANGQMSESKDTDVQYKTNQQISQEDTQSSSDGATTYKSTGDKVACVASVLGVSGTVGYLIVGACAGACAAGETGVTIPVCVACIGGYATVGGASVTAVASCFN